ncbi:MAG: hypothetical protein ACTJGQ_08660 [Agrococcus casei]|uniref:hypothetical protein n=1 Tax=Agrococcus casei TaxID=343512 RepID=UPI003F8E4538
MPTSTLLTCGIVLLTVVAIAYGGTFLLRVRAGDVATNELQRASFRAGHAHAGVLVILGLVVQILTAQPGVPAWSATIGSGVLWAAIVMPAGFFLSVIGKDPQKRNAWRYAIGAGGILLTIGVVGAGIGLISAGL